MTNRNLFLLLGTSLSLVPQALSAQCVSPIQDCYALGYTQSSCPNGKGVKCPFGSGWYCGGTAAQDCIKLGYDKDCTGAGESGSGETCNGKYQSCTCPSTYKYTCSGTGYSGGSGTTCGGKYTACTCSSGYEWKDGSCQISCVPVSSTCTIGTLYYSDGTCSPNKLSNKTLLGVVIYEKTTCEDGWIMTINPINDSIYWSTEYLDLPDLTNYDSIPNDIQSSCTNTDIIIQHSTSSTYPAAWAANDYKPKGTPKGKTWCLPSGGLLNSALNNQTNLDKINTGITTAGGTKIGKAYDAVIYHYEQIWSSSEACHYGAWCFYIDTEGSLDMIVNNKDGYYGNDRLVRPVMAF